MALQVYFMKQMLVKMHIGNPQIDFARIIPCEEVCRKSFLMEYVFTQVLMWSIRLRRPYICEHVYLQ